MVTKFSWNSFDFGWVMSLPNLIHHGNEPRAVSRNRTVTFDISNPTEFFGHRPQQSLNVLTSASQQRIYLLAVVCSDARIAR